ELRRRHVDDFDRPEDEEHVGQPLAESNEADGDEQLTERRMQTHLYGDRDPAGRRRVGVAPEGAREPNEHDEGQQDRYREPDAYSRPDAQTLEEQTAQGRRHHDRDS